MPRRIATEMRRLSLASFKPKVDMGVAFSQAPEKGALTERIQLQDASSGLNRRPSGLNRPQEGPNFSDKATLTEEVQ